MTLKLQDFKNCLTSVDEFNLHNIPELGRPEWAGWTSNWQEKFSSGLQPSPLWPSWLSAPSSLTSSTPVSSSENPPHNLPGRALVEPGCWDPQDPQV